MGNTRYRPKLTPLSRDMLVEAVLSLPENKRRLKDIQDELLRRYRVKLGQPQISRRMKEWMVSDVVAEEARKKQAQAVAEAFADPQLTKLDTNIRTVNQVGTVALLGLTKLEKAIAGMTIADDIIVSNFDELERFTQLMARLTAMLVEAHERLANIKEKVEEPPTRSDVSYVNADKIINMSEVMKNYPMVALPAPGESLKN